MIIADQFAGLENFNKVVIDSKGNITLMYEKQNISEQN